MENREWNTLVLRARKMSPTVAEWQHLGPSVRGSADIPPESEEEEEPRSWSWLTRSWLATAVVDYEEVVKRAPEYAVTRDRDVDEFAAYRIFHPDKKNRRVLVDLQTRLACSRM